MKTNIQITAIQQSLRENHICVTLIRNHKKLIKVDLLALYQNKNLLYKLTAEEIDKVCSLAIFLLHDKKHHQLANLRNTSIN